MAIGGYTGISFPFRVSSQGGVAISTTDKNDSTHIDESIQQIVQTKFLERAMESDIYSDIDSFLFEPNDLSLQQLLKKKLAEAITRLDDRVELDEQNIEFYTDTSSEGEFLYAKITYKIVKYQKYFTTTVKVGEANE